MRKENYQSALCLSERTRPVEPELLRVVFGFNRVFAKGFNVLLRMGVFRAGINNNVLVGIKRYGVI